MVLKNLKYALEKPAELITEQGRIIKGRIIPSLFRLTHPRTGKVSISSEYAFELPGGSKIRVTKRGTTDRIHYQGKKENGEYTFLLKGNPRFIPL